MIKIKIDLQSICRYGFRVQDICLIMLGLACEIITGISAGQSPAAKNPRPSYLWACTVFLSASAQSTLLLFFSVTLFAKGKKTFALQPPPPCCTCARKKTTQSYYT